MQNNMKGLIMETSITAQIEPGELYQVARKEGLDFTASEKINRLSSVDLRVEFDEHGNVTGLSVTGFESRAIGFQKRGWPFRHTPPKDEQEITC